VSAPEAGRHAADEGDGSVRRWSVIAVVWLSWSGVAAASEGEAWPFEARLDLSGTYFRDVRERSGSGFGVSGPRLAVGWNFQPLRDDGQRPLGVLEFLQHPDRLGISTAGFASPNGTLGATFHPVRSTGFTVGLGMSAFGNDALGTSFNVGGFHYLIPTARLELQYSGGRSQAGGPRDFGIDVLGASSNSSRFGTTLLLGEALLLSVNVTLGSNRSTVSRMEMSSTGTTLTSTNGETRFYGGDVLATRFFGRRLAASLGGGASGGTTELHQGSVALPSTFNHELHGSLGGQYFPLDNTALRLDYQLAYAKSDSNNLAFVVVSHALTLSLLLRM
jgi:hypothetical protein